MSKGHRSKSLDSLLNELILAGCKIQNLDKVKIKIYAPDRVNFYFCHRSERAFHPVRRWANKFIFIK